MNVELLSRIQFAFTAAFHYLSPLPSIGLGMFPNMVCSSPEPANSLTAYNASSTPKTLKIMTLIAVIGVPIVLAYTASVYYIFRGKVKVGKDSY